MATALSNRDENHIKFVNYGEKSVKTSIYRPRRNFKEFKEIWGILSMSRIIYNFKFYLGFYFWKFENPSFSHEIF